MIDSSKAPESSESEVDDLLQKKDFGISLRLAREKSGMSLVDVAQKLLISVDIIKALENSQTDALPALTFTQGYIRSYARLLGVSADEIINDYVYMVPNSEQVLTPNSVLPAQKCSNDKVIKLMTYSLILVAITVLVFWILSTDFKIKPETVNQVVEFNSRSSDGITVEVSSDKNTMSMPDNTELTAPDEAIEKATELVVLSNQENISDTPSDIKFSGSSSAQIVKTEKINNETTAMVDVLFLSAQADSWCEIQDITGKRLYYQLLNRGEEVELTGTAPFLVFLGNAPKVRVEVNNKIVDFENLINKNSNIASLEILKDATVTSQSSQ